MKFVPKVISDLWKPAATNQPGTGNGIDLARSNISAVFVGMLSLAASHLPWVVQALEHLGLSPGLVGAIAYGLTMYIQMAQKINDHGSHETGSGSTLIDLASDLPQLPSLPQVSEVIKQTNEVLQVISGPRVITEGIYRGLPLPTDLLPVAVPPSKV